MSHDYLEPIAARLSTSLEKHGFQSLFVAELIDVMHNYFDYPEIAFADAIISGEAGDYDWHYIETGNIGELGFGFGNLSYINVAHSFPEAILAVIGEFDRAHVYPRVIEHKGTIRFYLDNKFVLEIGRIQFEKVDELRYEGVVNAFKGINKFEEFEILHDRLKKVDGFETIPQLEFPMSASETNRFFIMLETFPHDLREMLKSHFDIELKQSQSLEIVANMFGADNWNVFKGLYDKYKSKIYTPFMITFNAHPGGWEEFIFYKDNCAAIAALINYRHEYDDLIAGRAELGSTDDLEGEGLLLRLRYLDETVKPRAYFVHGIRDVSGYEETVNFKGLSLDNISEAITKIKQELRLESCLEEKIKATDLRMNENSIILNNNLVTIRHNGYIEIRNLNKYRTQVTKPFISNAWGGHRSRLNSNNSFANPSPGVHFNSEDTELKIHGKNASIVAKTDNEIIKWQFKNISGRSIKRLAELCKLKIA
ncbi:MAG: hypothetical protein ACTS9Y_00705 [Methylophilus sp.]|uniref:hypothetical protein n=1 Tax=Methylophilus sp. TaxID=29541 RepID=UPI003F9EFED0